MFDEDCDSIPHALDGFSNKELRNLILAMSEDLSVAEDVFEILHSLFGTLLLFYDKFKKSGWTEGQQEFDVLMCKIDKFMEEVKGRSYGDAHNTIKTTYTIQ